MLLTYFRNYIVIGVTSYNFGCNSSLEDDGKSVFIRKERMLLLKIWNPGGKLPSVYADLRGKSAVDWIERNTAEASFCSRSDKVKKAKEGRRRLIKWSTVILYQQKKRLGVTPIVWLTDWADELDGNQSDFSLLSDLIVYADDLAIAENPAGEN